MRIPKKFPGQSALARAGVTSFGELDPLTDAELLAIPGLAEKTVKAIREARVMTDGKVTSVEVTREWWLSGRRLKVGSVHEIPESSVRVGLAANPPFIKVLEG